MNIQWYWWPIALLVILAILWIVGVRFHVTTGG